MQDKRISLAERDDAAIDLSDSDAGKVLYALIEIRNDSQEEEILLASCGESIAEILLRRNLKPDSILPLTQDDL